MSTVTEGSNGQAQMEADGVPMMVPQILDDAASTAMAVLTHHFCNCRVF